MNKEYKYFAFISYSSADYKSGKELQHKLESYRMPATLCSEHGWERKPIKPVFFAPTDIQPGGLTAELQERLRASRHLIVICSPHAAKSKWVGKEIEYFHSLGRTSNIHFFIVDGVPHSGNEDTECFNPIVEKLGLPEILGANIHEKVSPWPWVNKERAYVQLITKLLGVEFDSIWQRHKRLMREKIALIVISIVMALSAILCAWMMNRPVDVMFRLNETSFHNDNLPPLSDAIVTLTLQNEIKQDTISAIDSFVTFANIPHSAIGKEVRIAVSAADWQTMDTVVTLSKDLTIPISRDPEPYGNIRFKLWNIEQAKTYPYATVTISGHEATADAEGRVRYTMPLAEQSVTYEVTATKPKLKDILYMPNTESTMIEVQ